jgi:hypothetical protein
VHKESRFMLPVFPYFFIMMGHFLASHLRKRFLQWLILAFLVAQPALQVLNHKANSVLFKPLHLPIEYIMTTDPEPHSIYPSQLYNTNHYSLTHISGPKRPTLHTN